MANPQATPQPSFSRLTPLLVCLLGFACTLFATLSATRVMHEREAQRFTRLTERVEQLIRQRIDAQTIALQGLRGLFMSQRQVSAAQFRSYADQLPLSLFSGGLGFGYIANVEAGELPAFLREQRANGIAEYAIRPPGERARYFPVTYIEPLAANRKALGFDLASEPRRNRVVLQALNNPLATISESITLIQGTTPQKAFLLVMPVPHRASDPLPLALDAARGWVYIPLQIENLLAGIDEETEHLIDFELYEDEPHSRRKLIYDADGHLGKAENANDEISSLLFADRRHHRLQKIEVANRVWYLDTSSSPVFNRTYVSQAPLAIFCFGLITTILIAALFGNARRTLIKAHELANKMTASLYTKEQELRELLRELEQQRGAIDRHCIVAITDIRGTITYANSKFSEISGYHPDELVGANHRLLKSGVHPSDFFTTMYRVIASGQVWQGDICNRAKDGHLYWVHTTIVPFLSSTGKPVRYMAMRTDITALKETERELTRHRNELQEMVEEKTADLLLARDAAEAANRAKSLFISNMSHEMRTPLHGVLALATLGERRGGQLDEAKLNDYFRQIRESGDRLNQLVDRVLELASRDAAFAPVRLATLDLAAVIENSLPNLRRKAAAHGQDIIFHPANAPLPVEADSTSIDMVLYHLFDNAIRYSPEGSRIVLGLAREDDVSPPSVRLTVEDEGVGIPEDELESVFEDFTQSRRTQTGAGGTGMGLSLCRRIVASHGGRIWAETPPAGGTRISVTLPISQH